ncbi:MAG TPA: disulfide bond formation protein DsbA, partial [Gammaproteobacteria bacterium]|nr:disulfide bond formation protein DsbA [Gammaproteobacteria bacterium]
MTVKVDYFSDVLCVWAYLGQIRVDELKQTFGDEIDIHYRFVQIFGAAKQQVSKNWEKKGGLAGYRNHLLKMAENWPHIEINPKVWAEVAPESSTSVHLYLKAIQILIEQGEIPNKPCDNDQGRSIFEQVMWMFREAFFRDGRNISTRSVQDEIATTLALPLAAIHSVIDQGQAHAELYWDDEAKQNYRVPGSPTLVLNEGRQLLFGNVGYRVMDANVR